MDPSWALQLLSLAILPIWFVHLMRIAHERITKPDHYWSVWWRYVHVLNLISALGHYVDGDGAWAIIRSLAFNYTIMYFVYIITSGRGNWPGGKRAVGAVRNKAAEIRRNLHRRTRLAS